MRIHILKLGLFAVILTCILLGCTNQKHEQTEKGGESSRPGELTVSAAASLTDAITQISKSYEFGRNRRVYANFASSSTLQIQIENGAPADLFISASPKQMDALQGKGMIDELTRRDVLTNSLVLVAPIDSSDQLKEPQELTKAHIRRIAIGEPNSVPAGIYGKQSLTRLEIWSDVQPKLIPGADVRAVLAYVESGEVDFGIVYKTDAAMSRKVTIVYEFPSSSHHSILYPAAMVRGTKHEALAREFLEYLKTPDATTAFEKYGFSVVK